MPGRGHRLPAAWVIAACVALAALLAGCDGHSKPQAVEDDPSSSAPLGTPGPAPSSVTRPTTTASVAPASPPIAGESALNSAFPSAAAQVPAAIDTVRRFFNGMNHEIDTGDEAPVSVLFTSQCARCISGVVDFKNMLANGQEIHGAHLHLVSVDKAVATYRDIVSVTVTESEDAGEVVDAKGGIVRTFSPVPAAKLDFNIYVDRTPPVIWQIDLLTP